MSQPTRIICGRGASHAALVTEDGALLVGQQPRAIRDTPLGQLTRTKVYRAFLTNSAGSSDLTVSGSLATPLEFFVGAQADRSIMVNGVRFVFHGDLMDMTAGSQVRRFGDAAAAPGLANGLLMQALQGGVTTDLFPGAVQSMADFFETTDFYYNFINGISSNVDYLAFQFDLPHPVIVPANGTDRFSVYVRDDLTAIDYFVVIVSGTYELLED